MSDVNYGMVPRNEASKSSALRSSNRRDLTEPWRPSVLKDFYLYAIQNIFFQASWDFSDSAHMVNSSLLFMNNKNCIPVLSTHWTVKVW